MSTTTEPDSGPLRVPLSDVLGDILRAAVDSMQEARDGIHRLGEANPDVWQYATGIVGIAIDRAVRAEREQWRELVTQLVACHEEPTCPAVEWAKDMLAGREAPNVR